MSTAYKFVGMAASELEYTTWRIDDDFSNYDEFICSNFAGWAYQPKDQYEEDFVKEVLYYVRNFYEMVDRFKAKLESEIFRTGYAHLADEFTNRQLSWLLKEADELVANPAELIEEAKLYWREMQEQYEEEGSAA